MKIASEYSDGRLTVFLAGELDHHGAKTAVDGIADSIDRYLPRDLVLDLTQLGYIENPQKQPLKVLDASGIDRMIPIAAKREVTT